MVRRDILMAAVAGLLALAAPVRGQTVRGQLVEAGTGKPIEGAFVVLLAPDSSQAAGGLTDSAGIFLLRAPAPGTYLLRADMIGHRSVFSGPLHLAAGESVSHRMEAAIAPVRLAEIEVKGQQRCQIQPAEGAQTATLWEEARKALEIAAYTQRSGLLSYRIRIFHRELDAQYFRVMREDSTERWGVNGGSPFVSAPADSLAVHGYMRPAGQNYYDYFAPDAAVLLSDSFLQRHCFRVQTKHAPAQGLIGLEFQPISHRLPDVDGVLWLDVRTAELRSMDFTYTDLPWSVPSNAAGGHVEFQRVPTGPWIVRSWWIRMPVMGARNVFAPRMHLDRQELFVSSVRETGGDVVEVRDSKGNPITTPGS
jgi:Carboxypeptidase regulatory-like domain